MWPATYVRGPLRTYVARGAGNAGADCRKNKKMRRKHRKKCGKQKRRKHLPVRGGSEGGREGRREEGREGGRDGGRERHVHPPVCGARCCTCALTVARAPRYLPYIYIYIYIYMYSIALADLYVYTCKHIPRHHGTRVVYMRALDRNETTLSSAPPPPPPLASSRYVCVIMWYAFTACPPKLNKNNKHENGRWCNARYIHSATVTATHIP